MTTHLRFDSFASSPSPELAVVATPTSSACASSGSSASSNDSFTVGVDENQPPGKKRPDEIDDSRVRVDALSALSDTAASGVSSGLERNS